MLTDVKIRQAKPTDRSQKLTDAHGLYLEVRPSGSKLWRYRYRIAGRENIFAIGEYPNISLVEARRLRDAARELVKQGIHPGHARRAAVQEQVNDNTNTFRVIAAEWLEASRPQWSEKYHAEIESCFQANVYPAIGSLPVRSVNAASILRLLQKMSKRGAETYALHARQWISAVFRHAVVTLRAEHDPAAPLIGAIKAPPVEHARPMPPATIAAVHRAAVSYGGRLQTKTALLLMLYTFVRTIEVRQAEWDEFDLDAGRWNISGAKMKMDRPHIVPLSRQVVALLRELSSLAGQHPSGYLFPNTRRPRNGYMAHSTANDALRRMGFGEWSSHDFRATASTHLYETGKYRGEVIELQLAHVEKNRTKRAYNHALYLVERAQLMQDWADWVDSVVAAHPEGSAIHA